jgi:hypothetical protein
MVQGGSEGLQILTRLLNQTVNDKSRRLREGNGDTRDEKSPD